MTTTATLRSFADLSVDLLKVARFPKPVSVLDAVTEFDAFDQAPVAPVGIDVCENVG